MVVYILMNCPPGKLPVLGVRDAISMKSGKGPYVVWIGPWSIPIPLNAVEGLHPELKDLAQQGSGRPDKMMNLVERYYSNFITPVERDYLRWFAGGYVMNLDKDKDIQARRYFAEGFPVLMIRGVITIKFRDTQEGGKITTGAASEYTGVLKSWTVSNAGTGVCIFQGLEHRPISFDIDDILSDNTLIKIGQKPDWMMLYGDWTRSDGTWM